MINLNRFFLFVILIICTFSNFAYSQDFWETAKQDITSPFSGDALTIFEVGGGLTLVTLLFKEAVQDDLQRDIAQKKILKSSSKIGDFLGKTTPNIAYLLYMSGDYLLNKNESSYKRAVLMTKATLYSGVIADVTKVIANEKRPNGGKYSFPSGHSTTAFAFSSVVMMEHSLPLGIAANAMAAFVGFSRLNDNAHYLQDVIAGATLGTMYGVGLYYAQKKRDEAAPSNPSVFLLVPTKQGLSANYSINF